MSLLSNPGAIEFTNMCFFALDDSYSFDCGPGTVPSYMLDVVQHTYYVLCCALPHELNVKMQLDQKSSMMDLSDVASCLTTDVYKTALRGWMQNIWYFMRWYNERGNSVPLPSYVCVAFTNPEMTRRIYKQRDLAIREMGRCVGALVVNKLAADVDSPKFLVRNDEISCLSSILGTNNDDVKLLLNNPGAVQFTNVLFLGLNDFDDSPGTVPTYLLDVFQQTCSTLSHDLPHEFKDMVRLTQTDTLMNGSDRMSTVNAEIYMGLLHESMKNLWYFIGGYNECGSAVPLPPAVYVAFTNPEMTSRIHKQHDLAVRAIGRCIGALVVNKLVADIRSPKVPASNVELESLSVILGTRNDDVRICLSQPGTIELVNLACLALGDVSSFHADQMAPETHSVFKETLVVVSRTLREQVTTRLLPDEVVALADVSHDNFERAIVFCHQGLLKMCVPGALSLNEEDRASCLRTSLRSLWHCGNAYLYTSAPLPSYFPLLLASPEFTHHIQTARDPVARITGYCFGALVVSRLVDALESPIPPSGGVRNAHLASISAILGKGNPDVFILPHRLRVINFRNVVSIISSEVNTLSAAGLIPANVLNIAQDALKLLATHLRGRLFVSGGLPINQWRSAQKEYSEVVDALSSSQLGHELLKQTLDRLRQILEKLLPEVGRSQDIALQNLDH
ncbi:hypothetical protein EI94DRAFT_1726131 [Lactarius quietus]|nr:hypothetical protein EI94DRAFT_1726131 [Lactarius quietus]